MLIKSLSGYYLFASSDAGTKALVMHKVNFPKLCHPIRQRKAEAKRNSLINQILEQTLIDNYYPFLQSIL
jgi:hypothetical protein